MPVANNLRSNPKIQFLENRFKHAVAIVMEKVAGHIEQPSQYPLSGDSKSAERAIYNLWMAAPNHKRKKLVDKAKVHLNAGSAQRQQLYGDLAAVDLHSSSSVEAQIKNITVPQQHQFNKEDADMVRSFMRQQAVKLPPKKKPTPRQASVDATKVKVSVQTLTCNKNSEVRKDEISLGAFGIDANAVQQNKNPFFVGKFKKGESLPLGANSDLFEFAIDASSTGFPVSFSVGVFLLEEDLLHNPDLVNKLEIACFALWGLFTAAAFAIIVIGILGGPVTVIMAYIAVVLGLTFLAIGLQLLPLIADDLSAVSTDVLTLDAAPAVGDVFDRTLDFSINNWTGDLTPGRYTAAVQWTAE